VPPRSQKRPGPAGVVFLLVALFVSGISGFDGSQIRFSFARFFSKMSILEIFFASLNLRQKEHSALLFPPWHFESAEINRRLIDGKEISSLYAHIRPNSITQSVSYLVPDGLHSRSTIDIGLDEVKALSWT
jgi:hypothetical protein